MIKYFDFEKPIEDINNKISALKNNDRINYEEVKKLETQKDLIFEKIYSSLTSWQKVQIARQPDRPHTKDYIDNIFTNFIPLSGDKKFADDKAIVGGFARLDNISVMVIGTEKGSSMESRIQHNFGMAKPEGYRKVQRLFSVAEKFNLPIITLVDTAGAFPGKEAEERGQSESIASSIAHSLRVKSPIISIILGEGGSGGAIALATADIVLMLENSIYSVISPEGCASILWRSTDAVQDAAKALKLTASECLKLKIIDEIVPEKPGGAHRFKKEQYSILKNLLNLKLKELIKLPIENIVENRNNKFLNIT